MQILRSPFCYLFSQWPLPHSGQEPLQVSSPNGQIVFVLSGQAVLHYTVVMASASSMNRSLVGPARQPRSGQARAQ